MSENGSQEEENSQGSPISALAGGAVLFGRALSSATGAAAPSRRPPRSTGSEDPLADILAKLGLDDGGTVVSKQNEAAAIGVLVEVLQLPWDQVTCSLLERAQLGTLVFRLPLHMG